MGLFPKVGRLGGERLSPSDMTIVSVFEAVAYLETEGIAVQIVSLINLRRLYSPHDNPWNTCTEPDRSFWDEAVDVMLLPGFFLSEGYLI